MKCACYKSFHTICLSNSYLNWLYDLTLIINLRVSAFNECIYFLLVNSSNQSIISDNSETEHNWWQKKQQQKKTRYH